MYSTEALALLGAVKHAFDPTDLLNPGVIVDPAPLDADLRLPVAPLLRRDLPSPTPTTAETSPPRCTAASVSASAARTPPRPVG